MLSGLNFSRISRAHFLKEKTCTYFKRSAAWQKSYDNVSPFFMDALQKCQLSHRGGVRPAERGLWHPRYNKPPLVLSGAAGLSFLIGVRFRDDAPCARPQDYSSRVISHSDAPISRSLMSFVTRQCAHTLTCCRRRLEFHPAVASALITRRSRLAGKMYATGSSPGTCALTISRFRRLVCCSFFSLPGVCDRKIWLALSAVKFSRPCFACLLGIMRTLFNWDTHTHASVLH